MGRSGAVGGAMILVLGSGVLAFACARVDGTSPGSSSGAQDGGSGGAGVGTGTTSPRDAAPLDSLTTAPSPDGRACVNLCKQQVSCNGGLVSTISGVVHAPTPAIFGAADPIYNAIVYIPNAPVSKFGVGISCQRCEGATGSPLVTALTGPDGKFRLEHVPVGADIPLVIQVGRWRRQVVIPTVAACTDTAVPDELTRLPRNQREGDIPALAIATGIYDPFDCTLRKVGIDETEFTTPTGSGRVHVWTFGGHVVGRTPFGNELMDDLPTMSKYDLLLLPCNDRAPKSRNQLDNLTTYANRGGRVFLTDWSYSWLQDAGPLESRANWLPMDIQLGDDFSAVVDTTFPKGMAFSSWLSLVGAARPVAGRLPVHDPFAGASVIDRVVPPTQRWLYTEGTSTIQHLTFNTPVAGNGPDAQECGRVVFSQFHVADVRGAGATGAIGAHAQFPGACDNKPMTPQEKALEFMLFDLSSCVQSDSLPPVVQ